MKNNMATVQNQTKVIGEEEKVEKYIEREERFWLLFKTKWREIISTDSIGNDIYIETDREIRQVYLNGKPLL